MKHVNKMLLAVACTLLSAAAAAQDNRWGATDEEREQNALNANYLKEELAKKNYDAAAGYYQALVNACPAASLSIYQYGARLYRTKIARAQTAAERDVMVDSLMGVYDTRLKYFADHPKQGAAYTLDVKARDVLNFKKNDRAAIREAFRAAIEAGGMETNPETVVVYFSNLCEDYKNTDEVMPDEVIAEYDRLTPYVADNADFKARFDTAFGQSGAASCENLEKLFRARLADAPDDEALLSQAVTLMSRAKCDSDYYFELAEKYYAVKPSPETAIYLAQAFKNKGDYEKASKYLNASLATEEDPAERQKLLSQIAIVELVANNISAAASAAKQAIELNHEDGLPVFVLAQCYGISASHCADQFSRQAACWVAYDTMGKAVALLQDNAEYLDTAKQAQASFRSRFPSMEDCHMLDLKPGDSYRIDCGLAAGLTTTVRYR